MGFLHFFRKNPKSESIFDSTEKPAVRKNKSIKLSPTNVNSFNEPLNKLIDGDLPWGWIAHNRNFINKIEKEYSYFLHTWIETRSKSPKELYSALKSFVLYMEDVKKICESKGECFEFWFNQILTGDGYLQKRHDELDYLEKHYSEECIKYEKKKQADDECHKMAIEMKKDVIKLLELNDGILQSDFWYLFDDVYQPAVKEIVYDLLKSGHIKRTKSGRSYILHYTP